MTKGCGCGGKTTQFTYSDKCTDTVAITVLMEVKVSDLNYCSEKISFPL